MMASLNTVGLRAPAAASSRHLGGGRMAWRPVICRIEDAASGAISSKTAQRQLPRRVAAYAASSSVEGASKPSLGDSPGLSNTGAGVDAASANSPSSSATLNQLSNQDSWVAYLTELAGGDTTALKAALRKAPSLLFRHPFDQQRLDQLRSHLAVVGVSQSELLLMATRHPGLLWAAPDTVAAATTFLSQLGVSPVTLQKAAVAYPTLLVASVEKLQSKLEWFVGTLGATPAAALRLLPALVGRAIASTLEPRRQWLLQQDFTAAQVLRLAQGAPPLLYLDSALLQRRLDYFTHTCGIPAVGVRRMLAAEPTIMCLDLDGQLNQLKLRYWQQQLSYSLSDLPQIPTYLARSMSRIASRHSALRHLQDATPAHSCFLKALIAGGDAAPRHFGPDFYASFVKQRCGAGDVSVQELLQPLSASLSQPALKAAWRAQLAAHPYLPAADSSAGEHGALYAALHAIQQRDWALSDAGRQCLADEAAAKAADVGARATKYTAINAARVPVPRSVSDKAYRERKRAGAAAASSLASLNAVAGAP